MKKRPFERRRRPRPQVERKLAAPTVFDRTDGRQWQRQPSMEWALFRAAANDGRRPGADNFRRVSHAPPRGAFATPPRRTGLSPNLRRKYSNARRDASSRRAHRLRPLALSAVWNARSWRPSLSGVAKRAPGNDNACCGRTKFTDSTVLIDHHCNASRRAPECAASKSARLPGAAGPAAHARPRLGCP